MGTGIRPEISTRNEFYISKHRYYELKHYCLQYPEWKKAYEDLCGQVGSGIIKLDPNATRSDQVLYVRQRYLDQMLLIEDIANTLDNVLGTYILKGVTQGLPYTYFRTVENIPCCKDTYYDLYRKFFYILSRKKQMIV